jgi:XTP/dITP diphosphohydrolase
MQKINIVTGNPGKVRELEAMSLGKLQFEMRNLDIPEIQSLDMREIVSEKLKHAYSIIKEPVIVDDVSAELECLNGLPGPFIKFFGQKLGRGSLLKLAGKEGEKVTVRCIVAYYDGNDMIFGEGDITGSLVSPRGENGFGFDSEIVPDGETRTMAEMSEEEKMAISHRGNAFRHLIAQLEDNLS